jgi:TonB family protein
MQLFWTPEQEGRGDGITRALSSRLARFLVLSTTAHVLGAAAATWLSLSLLPARVDESLIVRTIDFVDPSPAPSAGIRGNRRAANDAASTPRATSQPRAAKPAVAAESAPPSAPGPPATRDRDVGDLPTPTPSPEEVRLAAATPKAIGGGAMRGPSQPAAAPGAMAAAEADAPVATVALPSALVGGGNGGGIAAGRGSVPTAPGGAGAGEGAGVDMADPDFSEYFRLIERRVRAAWKFPDTLGGTTQTVKIGFALGPEGSLREARVVSSSSGTLNDSALSAMKRAAPFPPLPEKFRRLAGQPLVMSFTVVIR